MPAPRPRVRWSPAALRDLREIGEYLSKAVPMMVADRVFRTINASIERVSKRPLQTRPRSDLRAGLRGALAGPYIVFYRPDDVGIEIVRVLHQSRDLAKAFEEPEPNKDGGL